MKLAKKIRQIMQPIFFQFILNNLSILHHYQPIKHITQPTFIQNILLLQINPNQFYM